MKHLQDRSAPPFIRVSGRFWRIIRADEVANVLDAPKADSAGRYHRPGQPALYMSPQLDWARIAVAKYMRADGLTRVAVPLDLNEAHVIDQRNAAACLSLGLDPDLSRGPWQEALDRGQHPPSWVNSDLARTLGADGLIDPSRNIPGGWHLDLFRWNQPDGPQVSVADEPVPVISPGDEPAGQ